MPFCPQCRYEYKEGVAVCPDCNQLLIDSLAEAEAAVPETDFAGWVPLVRLTSQQYADMIIEALEAKDIPAILLSGAGFFGRTGQMGISSYPPVGGGYTVMVPEECLADAAAEGSVILGDDWEKAKLVENL